MQKLPGEESSMRETKLHHFKTAAAALSAHCSDLP
jgi:hypothetical protein